MIDIEFFHDKHVEYIRKVANDKESFEFIVSQHLRMSGVYWTLTSISLLGLDISDILNLSELIDWVFSCQDDSGGFGGSYAHDAHILYTLSAIQVLVLCNSLDMIDKDKVANYIASLQLPDGSFQGDHWGEVDTRFSYCALNAMALLQKFDSGLINIDKAVEYILSCRNFDGGFGACPGAESHAGQIFCCIGALSIAKAIDEVDIDLLGWWLCERQCDSGGLNGRPEKQADVCYSWWILSCLSIIGRTSWIDGEKLSNFILECQDSSDGGIADRPMDMVDIFHTFFGICGLSLLGYFETQKFSAAANYRNIDPTYALPVDIVESLNLSFQRLKDVGS